MSLNQLIRTSQDFLVKHRLLITVLLVFIVAIALTIYFYGLSQKSSDRSDVNNQKSHTIDTVSVQTPTIKFERYVNNSNPLQIPNVIRSYTLKNEFSDQQVLEFGSKLQLSEVTDDGSEYVIISEAQDKINRGILAFHRPSGSFSYESYGALRPKNYNGSNPVLSAQALLSELGVADETVTCGITYQKKLQPDLTFVECRRDWGKIGLPVLNPVGVINTPLTTNISNLQNGQVTEESPKDESIINVSAGYFATGYARPNDFNTATVAVRNDGTIFTVVSNLRMIEQTIVNDASHLISPDEAIMAIENGDSVLSLTLPMGSGIVDWKKVYQNNEARSNSATITEITLSYVEKLPNTPQQHLVPMYTIRGFAQLSTGYNVAFTQTVPALRDKTSFLTHEKESSILKLISALKNIIFSKVYAQEENDGLQLDTFYPITPQPTIEPATQEEMPTPTNQSEMPLESSEQYVCDNLTGNTIVLDIPGLGELTVVQQHRSSMFDTGVDSTRFYYQSSTFPIQSIEEVKQHFFIAVEEQFLINVSKSYQAGVRGSDSVTSSGIKQSFRSINSGTSCPILQLHARGSAPYYDCERTETIDNVGFNYEKANEVANNVAERMVAIIQEDRLAEYASKPDIFPNNIKNLNWVYVDNSRANLSKLDRYADECYISGGTPNSPAIFLYPEISTDITVVPSHALYTYPAQKTGWKVNARKDGTLKHKGRILSYLYYEYGARFVSFTNQTTGYIVKWDDVFSTIEDKIIPKLDLDGKEKQALLSDINNAIYNQQPTKYIKISLLDPGEIEEQLPLAIYPIPESVQRIHLDLKPLHEAYKISEPEINPVQRNGFTAVELGVYIRE